MQGPTCNMMARTSCFRMSTYRCLGPASGPSTASGKAAASALQLSHTPALQDEVAGFSCAAGAFSCEQHDM
jgi:hypothetical protein